METIKNCACGCGEILKNPKNKYVVGHSNRDPEVKAKKEKAYLEKYGVTNPSKSKDIKTKKEETNLKKFGTKYAAQSIDVKNKLKEKWLEKYGVDNPSKLSHVKSIISEKVRATREQVREKSQRNFYKTILNRLKEEGKMGTLEPLFNLDDYQGRLLKYPFKCNVCSTISETNLRLSNESLRCFTCNPKITTGGQSLLEKDICDYIRKLDPKIKEQNRDIISPLELDIVSEKHKIAIEIDGLYWHSEITGRKTKFYHSLKRKNTNNCGYKLIQIFEDEWIEKQKIVKSRIKNLFGNKPKENCYELTRFCSNFNFSVIGGASKILKYFETKYNPKEIISYADKRWSDGNLYNVLGFDLVGETQPNYWYIVKNQRKHRFAYRKSELPKLLKTYDNNLSEWQNMQLNGYDRIWDCGSFKFEKTYL